MSEIMKPWIPLTVTEAENRIKISLWGRTYECSEKSFLSSIVSQGQEMLTGPVRIVGTENGHTLSWGKFNNFVMNSSDEEKVTICSTAESERFIINTSMGIEYDGCIDLGVSVMPQGRSAKQTMGLGLEGLNELQFSLSRLWIEIPFRPEAALFYQFYPLSVVNFDGKEINTEEEVNHILQSELIPDHIQWPFEEQIFVGNDEIGLGMFLESDEGMQPAGGKLMELIRGEKEVILRMRLLDSEPKKWLEKGTLNGIDLYPISYRIGFIATPVKEYPKNPYAEKNVHIDCFDKIPKEQGYEEYLLSNYEDTDEITLDRFRRLGINTIYLHEKWNDIQNSPFITRSSANRLRVIVEEAHKRDMKVIPYFGYEISTLSPFWTKLGDEVMNRENDKAYAWYWYRYPYQRAAKVCYNSKWQDIFVEGVAKLMDEFEFDGIYIDSMVRPLPCMNEKHGCGWRDESGKRHVTYPVWAIRSLSKKLYKVVTDRGGIINNHTCAAFNMAAMSFCHSLYEGEAVQQALMQGTVKEIPKGHFRSVFGGRNLGVPVYMLCYDNPPTWTQNKGITMGILYGILTKPNHVREHMEYMSEVWKLTDQFDFENAVWNPYYNNTDIKASKEELQISYYENDNQILLFCANTKDSCLESQICLKEDYRVLGIASSCKVKCEDGKIDFCAPGFDYAVILIKRLINEGM